MKRFAIEAAVTFAIVLLVLFVVSRTTWGVNLFYDVQGKPRPTQ